jgi:hypothetical protein
MREKSHESVVGKWWRIKEQDVVEGDPRKKEEDAEA